MMGHILGFTGECLIVILKRWEGTTRSLIVISRAGSRIRCAVLKFRRVSFITRRVCLIKRCNGWIICMIEASSCEGKKSVVCIFCRHKKKVGRLRRLRDSYCNRDGSNETYPHLAGLRRLRRGLSTTWMDWLAADDNN